jgi:arabinose-5-phosphate isomerase
LYFCANKKVRVSQNNIVESAKRTIALQANAISHLQYLVTEQLSQAIQAILQTKGRFVVSGIGKSGIIAQKIVATLNSTGTPAIFLHAADAIHGDLGMVQKDDVVMLISKSGDSPEIKVLAPLIKNFGNTLIAMVGNMQSYLAQQAHIVLDTTVAQEACPNNLAPTTSTTAQMVMGDVLAICLMEANSFKQEDFAKYHPGGALGKRMFLRVGDLLASHQKPETALNDNIKTAIVEISKKRLGATVVLSENVIVGIITDGDIRRMFEKFDDFAKLVAKDVMTTNPKIIDADTLAIDALAILKANNINQLVVTHNGAYTGILHVQDLVREGII